MKKISIAVPCYNEVGNVRPMAEKLTDIMKKLPYDYEIVFTDNCSTDGTKEILRELAAADRHIKVLINNRNYGIDGRSGRNTLKYAEMQLLLSRRIFRNLLNGYRNLFVIGRMDIRLCVDKRSDQRREGSSTAVVTCIIKLLKVCLIRHSMSIYQELRCLTKK